MRATDAAALVTAALRCPPSVIAFARAKTAGRVVALREAARGMGVLLPPDTVRAYVSALCEQHGPSPFSWPAMSRADRFADMVAWALDGLEHVSKRERVRWWRYVYPTGLHREMLRALLEERLEVVQRDRFGDAVLEDDVRSSWAEADSDARALLSLDWGAPATDSVGMLAMLSAWGELPEEETCTSLAG